MNLSDAVDMVNLVGDLWVSWKPDDRTATAKEWATALVAEERTDVEQAIREFGQLSHFAPALSDILDGAQECKRDRIPSLPAIPSSAELTPPADAAETKAILAAYWALVGHERESRVRLASAAAHGDIDAKIAAARQLALAQIEAESNPVAEGQAKPLRDSIPPHLRRSACGAEFGTPSVIRDGVAVCPRCSSPISEGCGGFAAEQRRERERA